MIEIWAFLTRQKVVWLRDMDGEVTKTVAKYTPFGYVAKRYWPLSIHNVTLLPNGEVDGSSHVAQWRDSEI